MITRLEFRTGKAEQVEEYLQTVLGWHSRVPVGEKPLDFTMTSWTGEQVRPGTFVESVGQVIRTRVPAQLAFETALASWLAERLISMSVHECRVTVDNTSQARKNPAAVARRGVGFHGDQSP